MNNGNGNRPDGPSLRRAASLADEEAMRRYRLGIATQARDEAEGAQQRAQRAHEDSMAATNEALAAVGGGGNGGSIPPRGPRAAVAEPGAPSNRGSMVAGLALVLAAIALLLAAFGFMPRDDKGVIDKLTGVEQNLGAKIAAVDGKASKALSQAENAAAEAKKASVVAPVCDCKPVETKAKPVVQAPKPVQRVAKATGSATATATASASQANASASATATPPPAGLVITPTGTIWLWHHHLATPQNPSPCIIANGTGAGLPPYCSSFRVEVARPGETKNEWLVRVGGGGRPGSPNGLYQQK